MPFTLAGGLHAQAIAANATALPVGPVPAGGFTPFVILGLTDEKSFDELDWTAAPSSAPGGITLPNGLTPHYAIALFDTGSQVHMLTDADYTLFDLGSVNRTGTQPFSVAGVAGTESGIVSDPLGVYVTGFGAITGTVPLAVNVATLQGQTNVALLSVGPDSLLPNVVGAPMATQYNTVISNSTTYQVTVGGTTYRSPKVELVPHGNPLPTTTYHAPLTMSSPPLGEVAYFPNFGEGGSLSDDPVWPTTSGSFFLSVDVGHTGGQVNNQSFFFDTGADICVISKLVASNLGIFVDNPSFVPDFQEDVSGAGGTLPNVPGMYIQSLNIDNTTGPLTFTNVPVLIIDLPDGSGGTLPGLLGTNVLSDRNIVINTGPSSAYLGISGPLFARWAVDGSGNWSTAGNWIFAAPNAADAPANFMNIITADRTVTVDGAGDTVGKIHFESNHHYLVNGPGALTLQVSSGNARIESALGSHTIAAPVTLKNNLDVDVTGAAGLTLSGTLTNSVSGAGKTITKTGAGLLTISGPQNHGTGAALAVQAGTLAMTTDAGSVAPGGAKLAVSVSGAGTAANFGAPEHLASLNVGAGSTASLLAGGSNTLRTLQLTLAGATNAWTGKLDVNDNKLILDNANTAQTNQTYANVVNQLKQGYGDGTWNGNGGIISSKANTELNTNGKPVTLGVMNNNNGAGNPFAYHDGTDFPLFAGQSVTANDVLLKYTYFGDADLSGSVNSVDYGYFVAGVAGVGTGWQWGDFDYSGGIPDSVDYGWFVFGSSAQGAPLAASGSGSNSVPEPASLGLIALGAGALLLRRRA